MSSYHCSIKSGKRGSAADHAAYIAREGKHGRGDKVNDLVSSDFGNLPEWADGNPSYFWKMADKHERVNGAAYRELEIALPNELSRSQLIELVRKIVEQEVGLKPFQQAIHAPLAALGGVEQLHVHVMFSDRIDDGIARSPETSFKRYNPAHPEIGGRRKDSGGKTRSELKEEVIAQRARIATLQNAALQENGYQGDLDHRSHRERGIQREPERHLGPARIHRMTPEEKTAYKGARRRG
jgi:hypothetical protein